MIKAAGSSLVFKMLKKLDNNDTARTPFPFLLDTLLDFIPRQHCSRVGSPACVLASEMRAELMCMNVQA